MNLEDRFQEIIDYSEAHLQRYQDDIDKQEIEKLAQCSFDFFQKVFSYMNGIGFAEYIRYRKMTLAGYDLRSSDEKVVDISYKYGYDSPTSFTRAFQQFHGITPSQAKEHSHKLRVYPKMKFKSDREYAWRMERKDEIRLIGKSITVKRTNNEHFEAIPQFWNTCQRDDTIRQLMAMDEAKVKGLFGLCVSVNEVDQSMDYRIMVESSLPLKDDYSELIIPENMWCIFDCIGQNPEAIQKGWQYLQEEWLMKYPFHHAKAPEIEWYSDGNSLSKDYLSQIWIPVKEDI